MIEEVDVRDWTPDIRAKLKTVYGDQEPQFFGTFFSMFGGDPLEGFDVYKSEKDGPHWHYITYGFSLTNEYSFELTFRLKRVGDEVPRWPMNLLMNIARYVFGSGNGFDEGHYIDTNGPIMLPSADEPATKLAALGFLLDPDLGVIDGELKMLQAIALTGDELTALIQWSGKSFLKEVVQHIPTGITDLDRPSLMEDSEFVKEWREGVERDGSAIGFLHLEGFKFGSSETEGRHLFQCGAKDVPVVRSMIKARVGKERQLVLQNSDFVVVLLPGDVFSVRQEESRFDVVLPRDGVGEIFEVMEPHVGEYRLEKIPLDIKVVRSEIRDQNDNVISVVE